MKWQTLGSQEIYKNQWIRVREDEIIHPSGEKGIYGVVEIPNGVFIVAVNSVGDILLVKQQRYCTKITSWELPGGGLKKGNSIELQAREELQEEAGMSCQSFEMLGTTQTQPGVTTQLDHFVLAYKPEHIQTSSEKTQRDEGISQATFFPLNKILSMIEKGTISHGQSITALMLYCLKNDLIKKS